MDTIAAIDPDRLPMPKSRARTVVTMAEALATGDITLDVGADAEAARWSLRTMPGIGTWTADYIAVRGLGHPDVMLSSDLGVRHTFTRLGLASTTTAVEELARRWRPWRSYATLHLWQYRPEEKARAS
jgi:AraC family transcriptional regulator of adaptative response / DNA-3-methyladenine glycosylase II